ncbi:MAG: rod shape-determining protein MreD [Flavobacteriales bacterium]|nr:rod shape-determining protein MreD [Flavobacteriales bacterium]|tara:strand:+ start:16018 stop:16521 length:504 start_codon:yes stop_codon:yes gene_type:complete
MNKYFIKYLGLIPLFVLLQVLVLNEILFFAYINPYLYLTLIISIPLKTPNWLLLFYAFLIGFLIDLFSGSLGFHSTATVFIAFIKIGLAKITIPYNILEDMDEITLNKIGSKSYIVFSFLMILIHNSLLFSLEYLYFNLQILGKIISSSIVTLVLVLILETFKNSKK